ncbi:hypothetical protein AWB68_00055 [Caballeronia choica]|uniref:Lipoprotein n=1 Tax=Caballeronia choica TaxID=326476 RepID=A0A158EYL6_9BURK|nr:hypothetical protein [Caballeronia choica]SAL11840.1 hypothetical protein AWB68_00055 [Caballeronia choica]
MRYIATTVMAAATMTSSLVFAQPTAPPTMQSVSPQAGEEVSHMISRPKTPTEYARNLKFIFDHDLLLQDEFYVEANLKDVFNLEEVSIVDSGNKLERDISIAANPPASIFPRIKASEFFGGSVPSAGFVGGKKQSESGLTTAGINFGMNEGGPNFDETRRIFGESFVRLASLPNPHGGPPPATDPHGNESWRYQVFDDKTEKKITLSFNPGGQLKNILIEVNENK